MLNKAPLSTYRLGGFLSPGRERRMQREMMRIPGLLAYYPFNEASGDAINRAPGSFGTFNGTVSGATQGATGLINTAYSFDGINDVVSTPEREYTSTSRLSLVALVNPSSLATFHTIMAKRSGSSASFQVRLGGTVSGNGNLIFTWTAATVFQNYENGPQFSTSTWALLGINFDWNSPGTVSYYKNGTKTTATRTAGTATAPDDPNVALTIGDRADNTHVYAGLMQHVAIFSSNLTDNQHLRLARIAGLA